MEKVRSAPAKNGGYKKEFHGFGEWHDLVEWAGLLRMHPGILRNYLNSGYTIEGVVEKRGIQYPKN